MQIPIVWPSEQQCSWKLGRAWCVWGSSRSTDLDYSRRGGGLAKRLILRVTRSLSVVSRGGSSQKPQLWLFRGGFLFTGLSWAHHGPAPAPRQYPCPSAPQNLFNSGCGPGGQGWVAKWLGSELAVQPQTEPFTSTGLGFFRGRMNMLHRVNRQSAWHRGGSGNVSCWLTDDSPRTGAFHRHG